MKKSGFLALTVLLTSFAVFYFSLPAITGETKTEPFQIAFYVPDSLSLEEFIEMGEDVVYGTNRQGSKAIGKGQCPLCHTFYERDGIGRCPNLFGVEKRSHSRVKEERYLNSPIKIGDKDPATGIVKGKPDQVLKKYRRRGSSKLTGEDYLRESLMCPDCYIVEGYEKEEDKKSAMPAIHKPPILLSPFEMDAVIAWLQYKDDKDLAKVTIPVPQPDDHPGDEVNQNDWKAPEIVDEKMPVEIMIKNLDCPLCHVIPGVKGAVTGILGPSLYLKTNGPKRLRDKNYKGTARNVREYIEESIVNPEIYIASNEEVDEPYPEGIEPSFSSYQIPPKSLSRLVDFLANTEAPLEKN
jgi:hypothetical protein